MLLAVCALLLIATSATAQDDTQPLFIRRLVGYNVGEARTFVSNLAVADADEWVSDTNRPLWRGLDYVAVTSKKGRTKFHQLRIAITGVAPQNLEIIDFWVRNDGDLFVGKDGVVYRDCLPPKDELEPVAANVTLESGTVYLTVRIELNLGRHFIVIRDKKSGQISSDPELHYRVAP